MKAKKNSGRTKGKSSGKRAVKDLTAHKAQSVKGGTTPVEGGDFSWNTSPLKSM
jgi:hypothetical protein